MRFSILAGAALALSLAAGTAMAGPINGTFNINGTAAFNGHSITFTNPANVGAVSGDFTAFGTCMGCVSMTTPLTYNPFTSGTVYSAFNGLLTSAFDLTDNVSTSNTPAGKGRVLTIVDNGIATLTGFDPTPGQWVFTANQFGVTRGTFSASTLAVPEPGALAVLGVGLLGLFGATKLRRS